MAKEKKQTTKHAKELKRVRQFINRAEKRGFRFSDEFKESIKDFSTRKLKSLKPEKLYSLSTALSDEGEVVSGTEQRKRERSEAGKKASRKSRKRKEIKEQQYYPQGEDIINNNAGELIEGLIEKLQEPSPEYNISARGFKYKLPPTYIEERERNKSKLVDIIMSAVQEEGFETVAWRLEENATDINKLIDRVLYTYGEEQYKATTALAEIIKGKLLSFSERMELGAQEDYSQSYEEPE